MQLLNDDNLLGVNNYGAKPIQMIDGNPNIQRTIRADLYALKKVNERQDADTVRYLKSDFTKRGEHYKMLGNRLRCIHCKALTRFVDNGAARRCEKCYNLYMSDYITLYDENITRKNGAFVNRTTDKTLVRLESVELNDIQTQTQRKKLNIKKTTCTLAIYSPDLARAIHRLYTQVA